MRTLILTAMLGAVVVGQNPSEKLAAALTVTSAPDQCAKATAMELWRKSSERIPDRAGHSYERFELGPNAVHAWFTRINREPISSECRWMFSDLEPGNYIALLVRLDGSGGSQKTVIDAGATQTLAIPAPTVTVSGILTVDGKPQANASISMNDRTWTRPTVKTTTDADGRYTMWLDRPDTYTVGFVTAYKQLAMDGQVASFDEGANRLDIQVVLPKRN